MAINLRNKNFEDTMEIISIVSKTFSKGDINLFTEGFEEIEFFDNEEMVIVKIQLKEEGRQVIKSEFHSESEIKISIYRKCKWEEEPYRWEDTVLWESFGFRKGITFQEGESFDEQLGKALVQLSRDRRQELDERVYY